MIWITYVLIQLFSVECKKLSIYTEFILYSQKIRLQHFGVIQSNLYVSVIWIAVQWLPKVTHELHVFLVWMLLASHPEIFLWIQRNGCHCEEEQGILSFRSSLRNKKKTEFHQNLLISNEFQCYAVLSLTGWIEVILVDSHPCELSGRPKFLVLQFPGWQNGRVGGPRTGDAWYMFQRFESSEFTSFMLWTVQDHWASGQARCHFSRVTADACR